MMRVQYDRYGGPEQLKLADIELPSLEAGQIRVRVMAASANPMDRKIRQGEVKMMTGRRFPRGLGHDFSGVVEAVGPNVKTLKVGDEVFGATGLKEAGAFAESLITDAKNAFIKPPALAFDVAAALPIVSMTAWTGLVDKAKLRAGQSVFVTGCLGGVGRAAVQLAILRGAKVTGSCSASARAEALALGVSEVFDYSNFDVDHLRHRFDVVFDTAGGLSLGRCDAMLKRSGVALHIVPTPGKILRSLVSLRHQIVFGKATPEGVVAISDAAVQGKLTPVIGQIVRLSKAIPAIIALETTGTPKGKLIIVRAS